MDRLAFKVCLLSLQIKKERTDE
jgi:processing peptidase subunit alpha